MTVRELITELSKLDQDKGIWVLYDMYLPIVPIPNDVASEDDNEIKSGDYIILAG